jgi:hypothetical protein
MEGKYAVSWGEDDILRLINAKPVFTTVKRHVCYQSKSPNID